jgi:hypothetical protein
MEDAAIRCRPGMGGSSRKDLCPMKIPLARWLAAPLLALLLLLGSCGFLGGTNGNTPPGGIGNVNGVPNTPVQVTQDSFNPTSVTIRAEQSVGFANAASSPSSTSSASSAPAGSTGSAVTVCMGQDGTCTAEQVGPTMLRWPPGLVVGEGQSVPVVFDTPGTYHVTIQHQSGANLTVTVQ